MSDPTRIRDVRMRGFQERVDVACVLKMLDDRLQPLPHESIALHEAAGRVLAEDIISEIDIPPFNRAAMDGYALKGEETFGAGTYNPLEFAIVGEAYPGRACDVEVAPGQAVRIMTGAPMPKGADAVVPAELAEERQGKVAVVEAVPPGKHVGHIGEDIACGDVVLPAYRVLRPQDVAILAAIGAAPVRVIRRPVVNILVTGDELLPCGSKPTNHHIVDSNSVMLEALVRRDGGIPEKAPIIPDRVEAIREAIALTAGDVVLISGGSSVGKEDHAPRIIAKMGELAVHGVAMRPASPAGLGFLDRRPVFLLPGNPVSCLSAYDLFAGRAIRILGGRDRNLPYVAVTLPLARKIVSAVGRLDYVRVRISQGQVEPLATSGASILSSTTKADGFVLVPRDSEGKAEGDEVRVFLYDQPYAWSFKASGSPSENAML
ncbi:MAG: molybdopterin molybdenumtransferase MoeA [Gemmatales bacterium]|nr:MAG: molybdopterin molybdenumtransferase MoeA [Gemmatales bacterium]